MSQQTVRSRRGTISVLTTERGLPVALRLDAVELEKPPQQLAQRHHGAVPVVGGTGSGRTPA